MLLFQCEVSGRKPSIGENVRVLLIAHRPTGLGEQMLDVFSGFILGGGHIAIVEHGMRNCAILLKFRCLRHGKAASVEPSNGCEATSNL